MSLLLAHGHADAALYPVGMLTDEASIVSDRISAEQASSAFLIHSALRGMPNMAVKGSSSAKANREFMSLIEKLTGADDGQA